MAPSRPDEEEAVLFDIAGFNISTLNPGYFAIRNQKYICGSSSLYSALNEAA